MAAGLLAKKKKQQSRVFFGVLFSGAPTRALRVGQNPILMEYGQPLFVWLSRD